MALTEAGLFPINISLGRGEVWEARSGNLKLGSDLKSTCLKTDEKEGKFCRDDR
jgi:hypothetical protein